MTVAFGEALGVGKAQKVPWNHHQGVKVPGQAKSKTPTPRGFIEGKEPTAVGLGVDNVSKGMEETFEAMVQLSIEKITQLKQKLDKEKKLLEKEKQEWEEGGNKPIQMGRVTLDIGGERFATSLSALTSQPGYFRALFSGRTPIQKDKDGCFFIDRDPCVFRHVVNYLRGQPLSLRLTKEEEETLLEECKFYELESMANELQSRLQQTTTTTTTASASTITTTGQKSIETKKNKLDNQNKGDSVDEFAEVWEIFHRLRRAYEIECRAVNEQRIALTKEKEAWVRLCQKIEASYSSDKIKLDVGGKFFSTTLRTLKCKDGFFRAKFSGNFLLEPEEDGSYFIDRDPFTFRHILNYLRCDKAPKQLSEAEMESLMADAEYYNLPELATLCKFKPAKEEDVDLFSSSYEESEEEDY